MLEIWKPVNGFEEKYEISNLGRIKNIKTNQILKMTNKYGDYFAIILYDKTHKKSTRIHRLVAETFIPNPLNLKEVNHIDGNKQNNRVDNLEWCTRSENINHALVNGLSNMDHLNKYNKNKFANKYGKIFQCDKSKQILNVFKNLEEAYNKTGVCKRNILQVINHQQGRKQAGGFVWISEKEMMMNDL